MANQDVRPNALANATNWTGAYTDIDEDVSSPDSTFLYTSTTAASVDIVMATPTASPVTTTNAQVVAFYLRKVNASGTEDNGGGDPLHTIQVSYDDGSTWPDTVATDVAITTATLVTYNFTYDNTTASDGSQVRFRLTNTKGGGGPNERHTAIDAVEWRAETPNPPKTLSGDLDAQQASISGEAAVAQCFVTGDLDAQSSSIIGILERVVTLDGSLEAQSSSIIGNLERVVPLSGDLDAQQASISGNIDVTGTTPVTGTKLYIDRALYREPNLWLPGKKPTGLVKINWDHSITKALNVCVLCSPNNSGQLEMVHKIPFAIGNNWNIGQYWSVGQAGTCLYANAASNISGRVVLLDGLGVHTGPHSFLVHYDLFTLDSNDTLFAFAGIQSDAFYYGTSSLATQMRVTYRNSGVVDFIQFGDTSSVGNNQVDIYTSPNDGNGVLYTNQVGRATTTQNADATRDNAFTNNNLVFQNSQQGQLGSTDSNLYAVFCWNRELSSGEAESLLIDPYQFLIPA